ncbi:MAG: cardiolipin synthase [Clostridiales bacterium]|nr:cardiolipin synthase [Clostridiales bacterium]
MISFGDLLWIAYLLNFAIIITIVCFQKRNPTASMAWIMCLIMLPVVGGLIFLIFGVGIKAFTRRKYQLKLEMNEKYLLEEQKKLIKRPDIASQPYSVLVNYFLNNNFPYTEYNDVRVFTDAKEKYDCLFKDIEAAEESINILYFIIRNDKIGNELIDLLYKKAKQGVKVRLMYDGFGSILTPRRLFNRLREVEGSEVAEFFPVRIFSLSKINHRNHRKIVVIDDKTAYLGGMNIGDEYMNNAKKRNLNWRDTHIRIEGEAVEYVARCFAMDWEFSTGREIPVKKAVVPQNCGRLPMQIVASGPDSKDEEIKCGIIKMIYSAKRYVYIQTPYFVPDQAFMTAIQTAAQSGIDVRVMIPGVPDKKYVYHTTMSYAGELLDAGVKVYLYPGFIHSKTVTVDDKIVTVGSTNIDIRSFQLLFEVNAFMFSQEKAVEHYDIFCSDMERCHELTMEEYKKRGFIKMVEEGFFRLFSPIM